MTRKLTVDYKDKNDDYDKDTVRYYTKLYEDGYFYELYMLYNGKKVAIIVTECGVSVDFRKSGKSIHTNIRPDKLFPGKSKLEWDDLHDIIDILEATDLEGKESSAKEMKKLHKELKRLGKP